MTDDLESFEKPDEKFAMPSDAMVPPAPWVNIKQTGPVPVLLHEISFESIETKNGVGCSSCSWSILGIRL